MHRGVGADVEAEDSRGRTALAVAIVAMLRARAAGRELASAERTVGAVRAQGERYAADRELMFEALRGSVDGVVVVDHAGNVVARNAMAERTATWLREQFAEHAVRVLAQERRAPR